MKARLPLQSLTAHPTTLNRQVEPLKPLSERQSLVPTYGCKAGQAPSSTAGQVRSIDPGAVGLFEPTKRRDPFFDDRTYRNNKAREARRLFPRARTAKSPTVSAEKMAEMMEFIKNNL